MPSAHLISIDALRTFSQAVRALGNHVSAECSEMRDVVGRHVAHARANLEIREAELAEAVENLRSIDDEDDDDFARRAVEAAKDALRRAQRRLLETESASSRFLAVLGAEMSKLDASLVSSHQFLQARVDTAVHYTAITNRSADSARVGATAPRHSQLPATNAKPLNVPEAPPKAAMELLPSLPRKMQWVPVDEIDLESVPDDLQFKKASYDDMRTMMQTFEKTVLPALIKDESLTADGFLGDQNSSVGVSAKIPRFAYECMLGSPGANDVIAVDAMGAGGRSKRGITSGRHRIKLAKELGWTHVPARVLGNRNA